MELAVLTLVAPSVRFWPKYNATNPIDWTPERICLTQVVWRTQPCEVGDVGDAPRMLTPGAQLWLDQKGARASSRQWWCAQRQHLSGVARLVQTAPNASWYLTLDTDTLIFPRPLAKLLELLERQLAPAEDLYTGHLHITLLSDTDPLASKIRPFIATGGGALIRGRTLRKLRDNFVLDRFTREQGHGELRWAALDWVLGAALLAVGVQPRGRESTPRRLLPGTCCLLPAACCLQPRGREPTPFPSLAPARRLLPAHLLPAARAPAACCLLPAAQTRRARVRLQPCLLFDWRAARAPQTPLSSSTRMVAASAVRRGMSLATRPASPRTDSLG